MIISCILILDTLTSVKKQYICSLVLECKVKSILQVGCGQTTFENYLATAQKEKENVAQDDDSREADRGQNS